MLWSILLRDLFTKFFWLMRKNLKAYRVVGGARQRSHIGTKGGLGPPKIFEKKLVYIYSRVILIKKKKKLYS